MAGGSRFYFFSPFTPPPHASGTRLAFYQCSRSGGGAKARGARLRGRGTRCGAAPAGGGPDRTVRELPGSGSLQALVKSRRKSPVGARLSLAWVRLLFWKEKRPQNLPQALVAS